MFSERGAPRQEVFSPVVRGETVFIPGQLSPEQAERVMSDVERILQDPKRFIDRGGAGDVYRLGGGVCIKRMEARRFSPHKELLDLGNPVFAEAQFLADASQLEVSGVRTCRCFGFHVSQGFGDPDLLLMEQLDAENLQHVINHSAPAPEAFNPSTFIDEYSDFLYALHDVGIVHGDIAPRNIMIDRKTGKPRVIDFGRSSRLPVKGSARDQLIDRDIADFDRVFEEMEKRFNLA